MLTPILILFPAAAFAPAAHRDVWGFLRLYGRFGRGGQMLAQAGYRLFRDGYDSRRWL